MKTEISNNIFGEIWAKGIVNAGINPLTASLRVPNGHLLEHEHLTSLLEETCVESIKVAMAAEVKLPNIDLIEKTKNVANLTAKNKSSMLQDVERKRKTEIDSINGVIVRTGEEHDVPTPINSSLVRVIKGIEKSYGLEY
jgi:2-dehydropantoate 2-reductase